MHQLNCNVCICFFEVVCLIAVLSWLGLQFLCRCFYQWSYHDVRVLTGLTKDLFSQDLWAGRKAATIIHYINHLQYCKCRPVYKEIH